tara:strand:+ start:106 stop:342 length:237 start_codon:yes stop_codon:yes gene_type:complete
MVTRSRENVSQLINDNTIYDTLMNEVKISWTPDPNKQNASIIVYEFPPWFTQHISETSQQKIIHNLKKATEANLDLCC